MILCPGMQKVSPQQSSSEKPICDTTLVSRLSRAASLQLSGSSPTAEHTPWLHSLWDITDTSRSHPGIRFPLGIFLHPGSLPVPCAELLVHSAPALVSLTGSERDRTADNRTEKRNIHGHRG